MSQLKSSNQKELVARGLDVAARSIDLLASLNNASSMPLVSSFIEIGEWLGREKLSRYDLSLVFRKAQNLIIPNSQGQSFFKEVTKSGYTNPIRHVFLKHSGSLGQLVGKDPSLRWMVSAVTCLFQFHREQYRVTKALCDIIYLASISKSKLKAQPLLFQHPEREQLQHVVDKIVSSIWLHVVNAGIQDISIPEELKNVCKRGHCLPPEDFSKIVNILREEHPQIVIQSAHILTDLALWLLYHFGGHLRVTVSGAIILDRDLAESPRKIELQAAHFCNDPHESSTQESKLKVISNISGDLKKIFDTFLSAPELSQSEPGSRQPFYRLSRPYPKESRANDKEVQIMIRCVAQKLMGWLLALPLQPPDRCTELSFEANTDEDISDERLRLSDVVQKLPEMLNMDWGDYEGGDVVFSQNSVGDSHDEDDRSGQSNPDSLTDLLWTKADMSAYLKAIVAYYPIIQGLLTKMVIKMFQDGCLQYVALTNVFVLLGHGIADAFGCSSVSTAYNSHEIFSGVATILAEFCDDRVIAWDTWFTTAASVSLGCEFKYRSQPPYMGGSRFAAVQHGGLVVLAPWLDMSKSLDVRRCFGLIEARGRFGIFADGKEDMLHYNGIEGVSAFVQTEKTQDTSSYVMRTPHATIPQDTSFSIVTDSSNPESDLMLVAMDDGLYRLLTRIRSGNHSRIIDPSDALMRLISGAESLKCSHVDKIRLRDFEKPLENPLKLMAFDDVLGRWSCNSSHISRGAGLAFAIDPDEPKESHDHGGITYMSSYLDTLLKKNVALALTVDKPTVVNRSSSCFSCVVDETRHGSFWRIDTVSDLMGPDYPPQEPILDRYIINLELDLQRQSFTQLARRKRKGSALVREGSEHMDLDIDG